MKALFSTKKKPAKAWRQGWWPKHRRAVVRGGVAVLLVVLVAAGVYLFLALTKKPSHMLQDSVVALLGGKSALANAKASDTVLGGITQTDQSQVTFADKRVGLESTLIMKLSDTLSVTYDTDAVFSEQRELVGRVRNVKASTQDALTRSMQANQGKWIKQNHARTIGQFAGAGLYGCVADVRLSVLQLSDGVARMRRAYQTHEFLQLDEAKGEQNGRWQVLFKPSVFEKFTTYLGLTNEQIPSCQALRFNQPRVQVVLDRKTGYVSHVRVASQAAWLEADLTFGTLKTVSVPQAEASR